MGGRTLLFEYIGLSNGSWNGKWTGQGRNYSTSVRMTKEIREKLEKHLGEKLESGKTYSFYYNFGDGWSCQVEMTLGYSKDFQKMLRQSEGFLGYGWMIRSIIENGHITPDE